MARPNEARRPADELRARWLLQLAHESEAIRATPAQLIQAAAHPSNRPLLKLRLQRVLGAQPGWGQERAKTVLRHTVTILGQTVDPKRMTVGWLLDSRAQGNRVIAFADALARSAAPGVGPEFPFRIHSAEASSGRG